MHGPKPPEKGARIASRARPLRASERPSTPRTGAAPGLTPRARLSVDASAVCARGSAAEAVSWARTTNPATSSAYSVFSLVMWRIWQCLHCCRRDAVGARVTRVSRGERDAARRRTSRRVSQAWSSRARTSAAWYARRLPRSGGRFDARVRRERLFVEQSDARARVFFFDDKKRASSRTVLPRRSPPGPRAPPA